MGPDLSYPVFKSLREWWLVRGVTVSDTRLERQGSTWPVLHIFQSCRSNKDLVHSQQTFVGTCCVPDLNLDAFRYIVILETSEKQNQPLFKEMRFLYQSRIDQTCRQIGILYNLLSPHSFNNLILRDCWRSSCFHKTCFRCFLVLLSGSQNVECKIIRTVMVCKMLYTGFRGRFKEFTRIILSLCTKCAFFRNWSQDGMPTKV